MYKYNGIPTTNTMKTLANMFTTSIPTIDILVVNISFHYVFYIFANSSPILDIFYYPIEHCTK